LKNSQANQVSLQLEFNNIYFQEKTLPFLYIAIDKMNDCLVTLFAHKPISSTKITAQRPTMLSIYTSTYEKNYHITFIIIVWMDISCQKAASAYQQNTDNRFTQ